MDSPSFAYILINRFNSKLAKHYFYIKRLLFLSGITILLITVSCEKEKSIVLVRDELKGDGSFEYNGRTYACKRIMGEIAWMIENLAYLPSVSPSATGSDSTPLYYVYGYEGSGVIAAKATENYKKYGVLYNLEAAKTACPPGWHLPSDSRVFRRSMLSDSQRGRPSFDDNSGRPEIDFSSVNSSYAGSGNNICLVSSRASFTVSFLPSRVAASISAAVNSFLAFSRYFLS